MMILVLSVNCLLVFKAHKMYGRPLNDCIKWDCHSEQLSVHLCVFSVAIGVYSGM